MANQIIDVYSVQFRTSQAATAAKALSSALRELNKLAKDFRSSRLDTINKIGTGVNTAAIEQMVIKLVSMKQALSGIDAATARGAIAMRNLAQAAYYEAKASAISTAEKRKATDALERHRKAAVAAATATKQATNGIMVDWASVGRFLQANIFTRVLYGLTSKIKESVNEAAKLAQKIAEVQTISLRAGRIGPTRMIEDLRTDLYNLSNAMGLPQADLIEAQYQAVSNQVQGAAESFEFLETAARFAKVAVTNAAGGVSLISAAIHSFNLSTAEAEEIAAKMFKTIELGRIRASDLEQDYGRSAVLAQQLGISLEELNSAFTVITTQGIKFANSQTYLNNIMLKLVKPTEKMKDVLNSIGVASGEMGIQVYGLIGLLQRLGEQTEKSLDPMGELGETFGTIRAITGATVFMNEEVQARYIKNIQKINEAQVNYAQAFETIMSNSGDTILREFNKVKNFFLSEVGGNLVEGLEHFNRTYASLSKVFTSSLGVIVSLVTALGSLRLATAGVQYWSGKAKASMIDQALAMKQAAVGTTQADAAAEKYTVTLTKMQTMMIGLKSFSLGLLSFGTSLGLSALSAFTILETWDRGLRTTLEGFENLAQGTRKELELTFKSFNQFYTNVSNNTALAMQLVGQSINQRLAEERAMLINDIESMGRRLVDFKDLLSSFANEQQTELKAQDRLLKTFKSEITEVVDYFKSLGKEFRSDTEAAAKAVNKMADATSGASLFDPSLANQDIVASLDLMINKYGARLDAFANQHLNRARGMLQGLAELGADQTWVKEQDKAIESSVDQAYKYMNSLRSVQEMVYSGQMAPVAARDMVVEIENRFAETMGSITQNIERVSNANRDATESVKTFSEDYNSALASAKKITDVWGQSGGFDNQQATQKAEQHFQAMQRRLQTQFRTFQFDPIPLLVENLSNEQLRNLQSAEELRVKIQEEILRDPNAKDTRSVRRWEEQQKYHLNTAKTLEQQIFDITNGRLTAEETVLATIRKQYELMQEEYALAEKIKINTEREAEFRKYLARLQDTQTESSQNGLRAVQDLARIMEGSQADKVPETFTGFLKENAMTAGALGYTGYVTTKQLGALLASVVGTTANAATAAVAVPLTALALGWAHNEHLQQQVGYEQVWGDINSNISSMERNMALLTQPGVDPETYQRAGEETRALLIDALKGIRAGMSPSGGINLDLPGVMAEEAILKLEEVLRAGGLTETETQAAKATLEQLRFAKPDLTTEFYDTNIRQLTQTVQALAEVFEIRKRDLRNMLGPELYQMYSNAFEQGALEFRAILESPAENPDVALADLIKQLSPERDRSLYDVKQLAHDIGLEMSGFEDLFKEMFKGTSLEGLTPQKLLETFSSGDADKIAELQRQMDRIFLTDTDRLDNTLTTFTNRMEKIITDLDLLSLQTPRQAQDVEPPVATRAAGGMIPNRPNMTRPLGTDSVMAALTPGEFVIKRDTVQKYGTGFFELLNKGAFPFQRRATGGYMGRAEDLYLFDPITGEVYPMNPNMLNRGTTSLAPWGQKAFQGSHHVNYGSQVLDYAAPPRQRHPGPRVIGWGKAPRSSSSNRLRKQEYFDAEGNFIGRYTKRQWAYVNKQQPKTESEMRGYVGNAPLVRRMGQDYFAKRGYSVVGGTLMNEKALDRSIMYRHLDPNTTSITPVLSNKSELGRPPIQTADELLLAQIMAKKSYPIRLPGPEGGRIYVTSQEFKVYEKDPESFLKKFEQSASKPTPDATHSLDEMRRAKTGEELRRDRKQQQALASLQAKINLTPDDMAHLEMVWWARNPAYNINDRSRLGTKSFFDEMVLEYIEHSSALKKPIWHPYKWEAMGKQADLDARYWAGGFEYDKATAVNHLNDFIKQYRIDGIPAIEYYEKKLQEEERKRNTRWKNPEDEMYVAPFAVGGSVQPAYSIQPQGASGFTSQDTINFNLDAKHLNANEIADSVVQRLIHMKRSKHPQAARLFTS